MEKKEFIYEGKAKQVYATEDEQREMEKKRELSRIKEL